MSWARAEFHDFQANGCSIRAGKRGSTPRRKSPWGMHRPGHFAADSPQVRQAPSASQVHAEGRCRRLHEACVFSMQAACVSTPVLRCGAVTTKCGSRAAFAAWKSNCVIAGAASNAVAEVAAANHMTSRPVASTDENATVSMFNWGFQLFPAVAFMIGFLSLLVAIKHGARLIRRSNPLNRKATNCGNRGMKRSKYGTYSGAGP
jgi:hypothetical protein